jgi:sigma-E factor negative regulatory protein RseB
MTLWRVWLNGVRLVFQCGLLAAVPCCWAQMVSGGATAESAVSDPVAWLARFQEAALRRNYQGTLVVSSAGTVNSSRVAHYCEAGQQYERIEVLDGEPRSLWRHDDTVQVVWPRARVAVVEQRDPRANFPSLLSASEKRVLESYELKRVGVDRVAGYDAEVMLLKARDSARFSQRLWAERQSGLLLRTEILGANGLAMESAAFSELTLGVKSQVDMVLAGLRKMEGVRVLRPAMLPTSLDAEGWQLGAIPSGFREMSCVRRSLDPTGSTAAPIVVQSIYSDGLTHVSIFIEPFRPERHQAEVHAAIGATHTLMVRRDDQWVTLMGDVPMETLKRFALALERRR